MTIQDVKSTMHEILSKVQDSNDPSLHDYVVKYIEDNSRSCGTKLYHVLCEMQSEIADENQLEVMYDVLEGLTGWCHPSCHIGTGDYHMK